MKTGARIETIFRFLVSKFLYSGEAYSDSEKIILFTVWERMVLKGSRDKKYQAKHGYHLYLVRSLIQSLGTLSWNSERTATFRQSMLECYSHSRTYFSGYMYFGLLKDESSMFSVHVSHRQPRRVKPKRFVGVGYNDHGMLGNKAYDGSPGWQTVAMGKHEEDALENDYQPQGRDVFLDLRINSVQLLSTNSGV